MSVNSSNSKEQAEENGAGKAPKQKFWWRALALFPAWVALSYIGANLIIAALLWSLNVTKLMSYVSINSAVFETIIACVLYILTLAITVGVPYAIRKRRITLEYIGLQRWPVWSDIGLAPIALIAYFLISALFVFIAMSLIPNFPHNDVQDVGFKALGRQYEYTLAFLTLVVIAPIAEEALFRGYLFGKLNKYVPLIPAILATSLLFAVAHLPGGDHIQWSVALDTFALSIILCLLRYVTGSIWAGVLLHMLKNAIAFYLMFLSPMLFMLG